MGSFWAFCFRHRNLLAALPLLYAFLSLRWEYEVDYVVWPAASLIALLGAALRAWARCHCAYGGSERKTLATRGPYAVVRNPLYVGNLLLIAAAGVASELEWFVPLALLWAFLVYCAVTRHEEAQLEAKYGDTYRKYRSGVPAWWPRSLHFKVLRLQDLGTRKAFASVFVVQALYASIALFPFFIKELNPFGLWPHP